MEKIFYQYPWEGLCALDLLMIDIDGKLRESKACSWVQCSERAVIYGFSYVLHFSAGRWCFIIDVTSTKSLLSVRGAFFSETCPAAAKYISFVLLNMMCFWKGKICTWNHYILDKMLAAAQETSIAWCHWASLRLDRMTDCNSSPWVAGIWILSSLGVICSLWRNCSGFETVLGHTEFMLPT